MDKNNVPTDVLEKANNIVTAIRENCNSWPEDYWFTINDKWDLNLWYDVREIEEVDQYEYVFKASLYPVENGNTVTRDWYDLFVDVIQSDYLVMDIHSYLAKLVK
jgi:hypothetical protein